MTDANDICIFMNQDGLFAPDQWAEFSTTAWAQFMHPDDSARVHPILANARATLSDYHVEYRLLKSDGTVRWIMSCGAPRILANGECAGYNGTIVDVSDRYDALAQIQKSEAEFRLLTEYSTDLISHYSPQGIVLYASPSYLQILGYDAADMLGVNVFDFTHPDDIGLIREETLQQLRQLRESQVVEIRKRHKDGHYLWMGVKAQVLLDATSRRVTAVVAISRDITPQREAKDALANREERFHSLTNLASDWYWETDADDCFTFMSEGLGRLFGTPPEDVIGKTRRERAADLAQPDMVVYFDKVARHEPFKDLAYTAYVPSMDRVRHAVISGEPVFAAGVFKGYRGTGRDVTERRHAQAELERSRRNLVRVLESIGDAFYALDRDWRATYVNQKTAALIGRDKEELLGKTLWEIVPDFLRPAVHTQFTQAMETGRNTIFVEYYEAVDAWTEIRLYPHADGISVFFHDITKRRKADEAVRIGEHRLRNVIDMTPSGYVSTDAVGAVIDVNPAFCSIAGYDSTELLGMNLMMLLSSCPIDGALFKRGGMTAAHGKEATLLRKDGNLVHLLMNVSIERDDNGNALRLTAFLTDITERKCSEALLEELATHDALTGLPNRTLINSRLQQMLAAAAPEESISLMFIDLDRFKEVNDTLGHACGDALLQTVAQRLKSVMQPEDMIARLGGDEFIAASHCLMGSESAELIACRLLAALATPFYIQGQEVFVSASIGISMFPGDGATNEALFQNADIAMYRAKAAGRNGYCFFEARMSTEAHRRMAIEQALPRALERQEFVLHYQPRINLRTMQVTGMEALIRWHHPQLGLVSPLDFIPIAEDRGFIDAIGKWVLEEACIQCHQLSERFGLALHVSVNVAARQLKSPDYIEQVVQALDNAGLAPQCLELELTESAMIENVDVSAALLGKLRLMGIKVSVDDFGTGYSGLSYLRRFPLDILKLDRSFLSHESAGVRSDAFIKAFVDMAHTLDLSVVAEGVEDLETCNFLRDCACDEAQGYFFAKPLALDAFTAYLAAAATTR